MCRLLYLLGLLIPVALCAQTPDIPERDLNLIHYDYGYPAAYFTVEAQRRSFTMAYLDVAAAAPNGRTVLLLHGKNFNGAYWRTTIAALTEAGFRVIAPDQIGFGKSSKPEYFQYSFHQLALHTKTLLDSLGADRVSVLGHSMGGMLATRFALMYPETVEKLVLENPIGLEDWKTKVPYRPVDWWYARELEKDYASIRRYQQENYYDGDWQPAYDEWVNILAGWTKNDYYSVIARNAALTYDMIFTQPVVYEFEDLTVPTLLIIGTRDRTALGKALVSEGVRATLGRYDKLGKATKRKIKDAKLVELKDVGHLPHIEAFDRFIEPLLDWLQD